MPNSDSDDEERSDTVRLLTGKSSLREDIEGGLEISSFPPSNLASPVKPEKPKITVRAIKGLAGVDFLEKGAFSHFTYVMGPVIQAMTAVGYSECEGLEAASYDWRLSPSVLQRKCQYFDEVIQQIESMDKGQGVVLFGHSMGNKVIQYLFNYILKNVGKVWIDKHIYSWIAAGFPTLGASAAVRALLFGDCMGLDAFLSSNEAIAMGRSFTSSHWLLPLPLEQHMVYVRCQGAMLIQPFRIDMNGRQYKDSKYMRLCAEVVWGGPFGDNRHVLFTRRIPCRNGVPTFEDEVAEDILFFPSPLTVPEDAFIVFYLLEALIPAFNSELPRQKRWAFLAVVCYLPRLLLALFRRLLLLPYLLKDLLMFRCQISLRRGKSDPVFLHKLQEGWLNGCSDPFSDDSTSKCTVTVPIHWNGGRNWWNCKRKKSGAVTMVVNWWNFKKLCTIGPDNALNRDGVILDTSCTPVRHAHRPEERYVGMRLDRLMQLERCHSPWVRHYVRDDLFNHLGDCPAPPVKRFINVTGVNLRTEVAYVVKLVKKRIYKTGFDTKAPLSRFVLDHMAELVPDMPLAKTHTITGGVIFEEPGEMTSGDGTVPSSSLFHPAKWKDDLEYEEVRIEGVNHRDMLSSPQLHQSIYDALTVDQSPQGSVVSL